MPALIMALAIAAAAPAATAQESTAPVAEPAVTAPVVPEAAASLAAPETGAPTQTTPAAARSAQQPAAAVAPGGDAGAAAPTAPNAGAIQSAPGLIEQVPALPVVEENIGGAAHAEAKPASRDITSEKLPHDLSPWNMFMQADIIVKAVMLGLLFASFVTWTVWFAKSVELLASKRKVARALRLIDEARSLGELEGFMQQRRGVGPALLKATAQELHVSWGAAAAHGIKERIGSRLDRIELAAARHINRGTGVLATIGSTAPFVGLFGTVWGIMNSFIGISESKTTNLAIVAPGIAEALLATAFGLVAASPAVIFYNQLARSISGYKALVGDTAAAVMRLASRDLERGSAGAGGLRAAE
jgi:biopolymer transport protein ExbB